MLLCEEYAKRHKIKVPFVQYGNKGCFFIKEHGQWVVFLISWQNKNFSSRTIRTSSPGMFKVTFSHPVHNGINEDSIFEEKASFNLYWDEYEDFILDLTKKLDKNNVVFSKRLVTLTAWEIFLKLSDDILTKSISCDLIYKSIDQELAMSTRLDAVKLIQYEMVTKCRKAWELWRDEITNYVDIYSYWIGDLVRKNGV